MVTIRPPKTIVKPTALGPVENTDTKLLIYGLFQKGRVLAQDDVGEYDRSEMLDGGVGCLGQVGSGLNVVQLYGLAQGVEERGDFGSAFRATAVVILAPNEKGGPYREGVVSVTRVTCTRSS